MTPEAASKRILDELIARAKSRGESLQDVNPATGMTRLEHFKHASTDPMRVRNYIEHERLKANDKRRKANPMSKAEQGRLWDKAAKRDPMRASRDIQVIITEGGSKKGKRQRYNPAKAKKRKFFPRKRKPAFGFMQKYSDKATGLNTQDSARDPSRLRRAQRKNNLALNTKIRRSEEDFQRLAFAYDEADRLRREGGHGITQDEVMRIYSAKVRAEVVLEKLASAHGTEKVYYMQSRRDPEMHRYSRHRRTRKRALHVTTNRRPKLQIPRDKRNGSVVLLRTNGSVLRGWYSHDPADRRQNERLLQAWARDNGYGGARKKADGNWYALKEPKDSGYKGVRDPEQRGKSVSFRQGFRAGREDARSPEGATDVLSAANAYRDPIASYTEFCEGYIQHMPLRHRAHERERVKRWVARHGHDNRASGYGRPGVTRGSWLRHPRKQGNTEPYLPSRFLTRRLSRKRTSRDFTDDVRHLSLTALGRLLRQFHRQGDEAKCYVIEQEIDRRTKGFRKGGRR